LKKFFKTLPPRTPRANLKTLKIPVAQGCSKCNNGYKGRLGIFESFIINKEVEKLILGGAPASQLREFAVKNGMITIQQDGVLRVIEGITTLEEIERVTGKIET